ncbi:beta-glucosidase [Oscillochloris sp. ZM17-4]|uniref:GH1 family beta-glucosidase n=1 Tax=Oscillochloris sp. ZM17-4 TaxID=2866714 RepID=UPI001C7384EB|nr:GH1 family beta-glucosidase [Oscillochloris sp. ZM17-4]MBX0329485.1 beta-glucosidase [Oscillochloris sp. ZM17-4]
MTATTFPAGFVWGAATAAYQIEGAIHEGGRGESIWDRFSHTPGKTRDGATGDVACDHYHRWEEDFGLLTAMGVDAYRFSIAWPRVLPDGRGQVNQAGLDFYSRQVDALLERGITPFATLYHWDLPVALEDAGGWPARATAEAFAEYAGVVAQALGDRVKHWITINEPWCVSMLSYEGGEHAPGRRSWPDALAASHHALLAHGLAEPEIRRYSPGAQVGITLNFTASVPASDSPADRDAARAFDGYFNRWFLDPVYGRGYPSDMVAAYLGAGYLPEGLSFVQPGDMDIIAAPTDFLGVNYYTREVMAAGAGPGEWQPVRLDVPRTEMGWEIYPEGLYTLLLRLYSAYDVPRLYITENGVSYLDGPGADGRIHDVRRIDYLRQHLAACQRAIAAGVPLAGYFQWSLMDNFEWGHGYAQRFGAVYVDYETQRRTPKDSFFWYRDVIARNGLDG